MADSNNQVLRRIDFGANKETRVSTIAGAPQSAGNEVGTTGAATLAIPKARFNNPTNLVVNGNLIFAQDSANGRVRAVSEADGEAAAMTGWLTCQEGKYVPSGICYQLSECLCVENETNPEEARRCSDGSNAKDKPDTGKPCTCTPANTGATCALTKECTGGGSCLSAAIGDLDGHGSRARFLDPRGLDINAAGRFVHAS